MPFPIKHYPDAHEMLDELDAHIEHWNYDEWMSRQTKDLHSQINFDNAMMLLGGFLAGVPIGMMIEYIW